MKRASGAPLTPGRTPKAAAKNRRAPASFLRRDAEPEPAAASERLRTRIAIALVGLVALGLLGLVFGAHRIGDYFTETDFYGAYAEGARLIQQGRIDPSRYGVIGPGYEVALALANGVVRDAFLAAELLSVLSALVTLWLTFAVARRLTDGRVALATLLLLATNPYLFRYGYAATTDAFALALQTGALAALVLGRGSVAALGAGVLAAFAFLTRYNTGVLLPAGLAIVAFGGTPQHDRRRAALLFAAGFALPVAPWVAWSLAHGGRFSFQLHHNIAYEVFAHARGITWDVYQREMQSQFHSLADVIARDPGAVASRMAANLFGHAWNSARSLIGWPVALAAVLGAVLGWLDGSLRRAWPMTLTGALLYATLVPVFYSERYALAVLPAALMLAGILFGSARFAFPAGARRGLWLKSLAFAAVLIASLAASWRLQARALDQLPTEVLEVARVLEALSEPGDRVIARKSHLAYHARLEALPFPFDTSLAALGAYAREQRARWLYFSWPEAETRPQFFYLLDTTAVVPGLTVRARTSPHPAVLYEIGPEFGRDPEWLANDTLLAYHSLRGRLLVDGNDGDAAYNYSVVLRAMGDPEQAMAFAARSRPLLPGRIEPTLMLGILSLDAGNADGAQREFLRVLKADPRNQPALLGLGWSRSALGDAPGAAQAWRQVVDQTGDPATLAAMIEVFDAAGDPAAAARARARLAAAGGTP